MRKLISRKTEGISGILSPVLALSIIGVSIHIHPWFDWADNALSDLGAIGTPYNLVFNLGLIVSGLLGLLFSLGLYRMSNSKIGAVGSFIFGGGLVFLVLVGVFPSGTPPHFSVSVAFFTLSSIGMLLAGFDSLIVKSERVWGLFVLSVLALGLAFASLTSTIPCNLGIAIPEMIGVLVFSEFSIGFGLRLLRII